MIPNKIHVLGVPFNVELTKFEDESQFGEMVGIYRKIQINQDLDSKRQWSTLLHEYIHAVLYVMGAGVVIEHGLEECITQSLEHGIEQFLKQVGPEIMASLIEGD
jgi:hypothetical protein